MQSNEYLRQLDKYLKKVPEHERREAIAYYAEYIADAGPEGEQQVMENLGSPARLAASIRSDLAMLALDDNEPGIKKGISAVWFGVLGVLAAPIALPIAIAIFAVLFSLVISIFAICFSLIISAIAVAVSGLAVFIFGLVIIPQSLPTALFYIGGGLVILAIGFFFCLGMVLLSAAIFRGIAKLFKNIRKKREIKKARKYGYEPSDSGLPRGACAVPRHSTRNVKQELEPQADNSQSVAQPDNSQSRHSDERSDAAIHEESGSNTMERGGENE